MKLFKALLLALVVLGALGIVLVPAFVLQPFAPQTPDGVALAYALRSASPLATLALLAAGVVLAVRIWPATRWWGKLPLGLCVLLLAAAAVLARQNHFEWMFKPLPHARFVEVAAATHLADTDMVLAVEAGGEARAYPVRMMAYHHVLNDVVGGEAFVVTY